MSPDLPDPAGAPAGPPGAVYEQRVSVGEREAAQLLLRARGISTWRILTFFLGALCALAAGERWPQGVPAQVPLGLFGLCLVAFVGLVVRHQRVLDQHERAAQRVAINRRGLRRLDGSWITDEPAAPQEAAAPLGPAQPERGGLPVYAGDLDLCGTASLWQLCDCTHTQRGQRALLLALSRAAAGVRSQQELADLLARQAAVRELGPLLDLRQGLEVEGRILSGTAAGPDREARSAAVIDREERGASVSDLRRGKGGHVRPDPGPFLRWAEGPAVLGGRWPWLKWALLLPLLGLALLLAGLAVTAAGGAAGLVSGAYGAAGVVFAVQVGIVALTSDAIQKMMEAVGGTQGRAAAYGEMLTIIDTAALSAPANRALQEALRSPGGRRSPAQQMRRLQGLYGYLQLRQNPLVWLPVNLLGLWDVAFGLLLERWQREVGPHVRPWLEALGEFEARCSLATLGHDNPDWAWPELRLSPVEVYAEDLGHPLLPAGRRVGNDVDLPGPGRAWLVTGSNMSGKSTLLRAIGLLQVLAQAGAPVCARRARLAPLPLRTVMRIEDNLAQGVSHFYAELRRLKEALDSAQRDQERSRAPSIESAQRDQERSRAPSMDAAQPPLLYLLDEILHGTNTRERELGARAVVKELCRCGALGAVSTHDLSLASLEQDTGGAVVNVHFTETVHGSEMTFDYKLRQGPVQTTNALRLMRLCGIPLDWDSLPQDT